METEKCVVVIDETLSPGVAANAAAILGITLGKQLPEVVGEDVQDRRGRKHLGIIEFPVPVLKASPERLLRLREELYQPEFQDLTAADFPSAAQGCRTYGEYVEKMAAAEDLSYLGVAICGGKKKINRLTGNLPLFR